MDRAPSNAGSSRDLGDLGYDLDLNRAVKEIRERRAARVGLQAPEGLKRALPAIVRQIAEETGAEVIVSGDPCYGACDIDTMLCREVDLMLHLGHADLGLGQKNVLFLEARMRDDLREVTLKAVPVLKENRIGVATTIQHIGQLEGALEVLKEHGIEGVLGPAGGRVSYPGQVLGCCYASARAAEAEEYLFIGTGRFHPLGIALATGKRVVAADPVTGQVAEIDPDRLLRRRFGAIARAAEAKRFAVLVSKKPGQRRIGLARRMKAAGEEKGKEMFLVYIDNIEPDRLLNLGAEAAVSTACPRIALDDAAKYRIPILTPPEFEVLVGKRRWEECGFDEIEQTD